MDWLALLGIGVGLFVAAAFLKDLVSLAMSYLLFVGLAGVVTYQQEGRGVLTLLDLDTVRDLALQGLVAFAITSAVIWIFFRQSKRWRPLLMAVIGYGVSFATVALWLNP